MSWLECEKDKHLEYMLQEPLKKMTVKQKAEFALICTIRALPLLSVKRFEHWLEDQRADFVLPLFKTVDLCAGHLKHMLSNKMYVHFGFPLRSVTGQSDSFLEDFVDSIKYFVLMNPDEPKVKSTFAVIYIFQAVHDLTNAVRYYNSPKLTPEMDADRIKHQEQDVEKVYYNVNAAFNAVFTDHKKYLVAKLQEILEDDASKIRRNETEDLNNDLSLYDGMFTTFQHDLGQIGLGSWARIYTSLFHNHLQFNNNILSNRIFDHEQIIKASISNPNAETEGYRENCVDFY